MNIDPKNLIALGALVVSLGSAWTAWKAREATAAMAEREFATEKTLDLLARVYTEVLEAQEDETRARWSCFFVETLGAAEGFFLGRAEAEGAEAPPQFVRAFVRDVTRAGLWAPSCGTRLEAVISDEDPAFRPLDDAEKQAFDDALAALRQAVEAAPGPVDKVAPPQDAPPVRPVPLPGGPSLWPPASGGLSSPYGPSPLAPSDPPPPIALPAPLTDGGAPAAGLDPPAGQVLLREPAEPPTAIGLWHALAVSYELTPEGCARAAGDVARIAAALAGQGVDDLPVYVARTEVSRSYAVTVDAGADEALAGQVVALLRRTTPDAVGGDAFVQGNRGWRIDPACVAFDRVGE